ncbi:hypothetical protein EGW08_016489 [Elysia chlorotica]|uniref:Uncharacterized protein n=1 Tax=Elysia chlorotica TaxID=188477 RepID=A0A3S0ZCH9_ELYCH|nr:hypothetical protein EGW08_016489 [Elysia chlorotica]
MLRLSEDPPVNLPPDVGGIGTIVEEYEGGFTPRGPSKDASLAQIRSTPDSKLPHFTPKEIYEHNDRSGNVDWYLSSDLDSDPDGETKNKDSNSFNASDSNHIPKQVKWNYHSVYNMLRAGLDKVTLNQFLHGCCVGLVVQPNETRFWEDVRSDVRKVLDDLIRADVKDTLSEYSAEYMHLLQRWMAKHRQTNPELAAVPEKKDMNQVEYPLPEEIARSPEVLREWLETWVPLDLDLPQHGTAWDLAESQVAMNASVTILTRYSFHLSDLTCRNCQI